MEFIIIPILLGLILLLMKDNMSGARPAASAYRDEADGPISAAQIKLVQDTWEMVKPIKETAAELFYGRLFELDPSVKPLFKSDMVEQGEKLMTSLNVVVSSLTKLDAVVPVLQDMGKRHVDYGVLPEHYDSVGAAFLWTLEQGLGDAFNDDVRDAWATAYGLVATTMKDAAY